MSSLKTFCLVSLHVMKFMPCHISLLRNLGEDSLILGDDSYTNPIGLVIRVHAMEVCNISVILSVICC